LDILCQPAKTTGALSTADVCVKMDGLRRYGATGSEIDSALPPDIDVRWDWQYADRTAEQIPEGRREAIETAVALCVARLLDGQNQDGGWGSEAGSRKRTQSSEPVVTGAALESLASCGDAKLQPALNRGRHFLRSQQCGDGSWAKPDGAQPILCTSAAIRGLLAAGASADDDCIAAAANWLVVQQQPSGAWNGSATQSAWALLGLIAAGKANHLAVRRGIEFLLDTQDDDGGWIERQAVLRHPESNHWFRNDLHSVCWPLLALSRFAVAAISAQPAGTDEMSLRLVASAAEF
jgi:squalene-hopene/tetraprenyl-beta-curcumene cyclase